MVTAKQVLAHIEKYAAVLRRQCEEYIEYGQPANAVDRAQQVHGIDLAVRSARMLLSSEGAVDGLAQYDDTGRHVFGAAGPGSEIGS